MDQQRPSGSSGPSSRPSRPYRDDREGGRPRRYGQQMRRVCPFCADPKKVMDYKDADQLRRYLTDRGKIKPRRKIGTCSLHQRRLALTIKRARHLALLPFAPEHLRS